MNADDSRLDHEVNAELWLKRAEALFDTEDYERLLAARAAAAIGYVHAQLAQLPVVPAHHRRERWVGGWGGLGIAIFVSTLLFGLVFLAAYGAWLVMS